MGAMITSAFLFGSAMFSVPTAITEIAKTSLPVRAWGPAVAFFTLIFSIGQAIGPVVTGGCGSQPFTAGGARHVGAGARDGERHRDPAECIARIDDACTRNGAVPNIGPVRRYLEED